MPMKMVDCLKCGARWPVEALTKCDNCGETAALKRVEIKTSLELVFEAYSQQTQTMPLTRLGVVGSTDVYPLILQELSLILEDQVEFLLYGSAALWLEGKPRPDKSEFQTIKDLDMCAFAEKGVQATEELLKKLIKNTIVGQFIVWDKEGYVFLSNGNTLEFMSLDHLIQFSFSLKDKREDFNAIAKLGKPVRLPVARGNTMLSCAGLAFISAGLLSTTGLFRTTLFRSDKTEKILIYACLCIGYGTVKSSDVIQCLVVHLAGANWSDKKAQLSNVSIDRNTKRKTRYFEQTEDMIEKLDQIKSFRGRQDQTTYNQTIESNLAAILKYIAGSKVNKSAREELVNKRLKEALEERGLQDIKELSVQDRKNLMIEIQQKVTKETPNASLDKALELTLEDATAIWESEIGTAMLIFLTEQLVAARSTISGCKWIKTDHRNIILKGYEALMARMLIALDERLEKASNDSTATKSSPKSTPSKKLPNSSAPSNTSNLSGGVQRPMVMVGVGRRVRIAYHLHYDVVGTVVRTTNELVTIKIENCYRPGTTEEFRSDHTAIVMSPPAEMSWMWQPDLFSEILD